MAHNPFPHVNTWVFDLDNTLYPPSARLFDQIERKMTGWVMERLGLAATEADRLRADYWARYGTTLSGLMAEHGIAPEDFLGHVHDIDFSGLTPDPQLARALAALPGRRIVFTNADVPYAHKVLAARGLTDLFDAVYGIENAGFHPKPQPESFAAVFAADGLDPSSAAMFEDDPRNLVVPHGLGMGTIHVAPEALPQPHIHQHTDDLTAYLTRLTGI